VTLPSPSGTAAEETGDPAHVGTPDPVADSAPLLVEGVDAAAVDAGPPGEELGALLLHAPRSIAEAHSKPTEGRVCPCTDERLATCRAPIVEGWADSTISRADRSDPEHDDRSRSRVPQLQDAPALVRICTCTFARSLFQVAPPRLR
jgi:hypothetical protein